jgi:hypothetical protein
VTTVDNGPDQPRPVDGPSMAAIPGTAELLLPIVVCDWMVIAVSNFRCQPAGCAFQVSVRSSRLLPDTPVDPRSRPKSSDPHRAMNLTVGLPDGTTVAFKNGRPEPGEPILSVFGSGGTRQAHNIRYRLSPLPTSGILRFTIDWPAADIHRQSAETDTAPLRTAARSAVQRWD